jgi:predicted DNA-binding protein (UPF0251 family)
MSRTQDAIALMKAEGLSANAASKRIGVSVSAVLAGLKRERKKIEKQGICPHCGQKLPEKTIDTP